LYPEGGKLEAQNDVISGLASLKSTGQHEYINFSLPLHINSSLSTTPENPLATPAMAEACRILVMASGNGSNFQALCDAVAGGQIPNSSIIRLIVNRRKAHATKRAEQNGIPWDYFNLISHGFQAKTENDPKRLQEARDEDDAALAKSSP